MAVRPATASGDYSFFGAVRPDDLLRLDRRLPGGRTGRSSSVFIVIDDGDVGPGVNCTKDAPTASPSMSAVVI
uniref:Uncharacterized protein n=1 Tax=Oryza sativa subsp. japonica TaxID=39947 RepID=Q6Z1J7_ORYSJ|nr:hypothetical protein [Oryza sativa Japonica Group]